VSDNLEYERLIVMEATKMSNTEYTILESWPMLKKDLISFLSDTDAWVITELRKAYEVKDWGRISNVIDLMDSVHDLSHSH
jgi:hypothetical protein